MKDFNWNKLNVLKELKELKLNNKASQSAPAGEMARLQRNILMQAGLALLTIVLTIVILFAVTSAWYTNIVQTSGLVFNVESWGFDGTVSIINREIFAAPGDKGFIYLNAKNENDDIMEVKVSVSKDDISKEMQKRLFFYVDAQTSREGENMERIYINGRENYAYLIFSNGSLTLEEYISNAPRLKWQWVYDVLGYYVYAEPNGEGTLSVKEYLRPIEYDLEKASFAVGETIELESVDGVPVEEFLTDVFSRDGYAGQETEAVVSGNKTYYKVSVDEDGKGVYVYLCNYSEIDNETKIDTELGNLAYRYANDDATLTAEEIEKLRHEVTVIVEAQKIEIEAAEINTVEELKNAISTGAADTFRLGKDIELTETLSIPEGAKILIDLDGKTIKSSAEVTSAVEVGIGGSLTMINGSLEGPETHTGNNYGIKTVGAEVVMSNVQINEYTYGIYVGDNAAGNYVDSRISINNCTIDSPLCSVFVSGNGDESEQQTQVVIEDSTLHSDGYVICGNGSPGRWGTDIRVINSKLYCDIEKGYSCIYQPQRDSTLIMSKCILEGPMGIALKSGYVTLIDTDITAKGSYFDTTGMDFLNSGYNGTNDAVYIETNYEYEIGLEIRGNGTITSENNLALRVFKEDSGNYTIDIYGGTFSSAIKEEWLANGAAATQYDNGGVFVYTNAQEETEDEGGIIA